MTPVGLDKPEPLDPLWRQTVERYHANQLPIDRIDAAFLQIVGFEPALAYLEELERLDGTAASASESPERDVQAVVTPPRHSEELTPAVKHMRITTPAVQAHSVFGFLLRLAACIAMAALAGAIYWTQPAPGDSNARLRPAIQAGVAAN